MGIIFSQGNPDIIGGELFKRGYNIISTLQS